MYSVIFDGQVRVVDTPKPTASGSECLIRLLKAGICNTDIEITPSRLLYKTLPLESAREAFALAQKPGILKVALAP